MSRSAREEPGDGEPRARVFFHRSELQFRRLLDTLPAGAYTCDPEGLITYFNPNALQIWGRAPKLNDPVDRFCGSFKLSSVEGEPIPHDQCWMALALKSRSEYNGHEIVIERPDGRRVTALAHANPILDDDGVLVGAVNVLVDITERKAGEDALKDGDRRKNEFLATLAHELRNPLAPIRNAVQILNLTGSVTPEGRGALDVIERQMRQMTRLIDDLMDVSRITRNELQLRREPVELARIIHAGVESSRPLLQENRHEFSISLPEEPILLDADLTRLAQVVSNLLNNAARYTDRGGRITLTAARQQDEAVLTVRDTGVGIPADMLPRIFEMFTQLEPSRDRSQRGLGIGLTLAKRLVEMHGGSLTAHSEGVGRGSEFVVRLPVAAISSVAPRESVAEKAASPASAHRILVVDDNEDSAESLGTLLSLTGNTVRTAHDGVEALRAAEEFRPEVVLLDIGLPGMNGYDAGRAIRASDWGRDMILIALTGWGQTTDKLRSKDAGFDYHLVKPVDPSALMSLLASLETSAARPV